MIFQNIGFSPQFLKIFAFIYQLLMIDFKILNEQTCFIEMISKINFFLISQNLEAATQSRSGKEVFLGSRELLLRNAYGRGYFQSNVAQCFSMTLPIFKFLVFWFFLFLKKRKIHNPFFPENLSMAASACCFCMLSLNY